MAVRRILRRALGLSQSELAARLQVAGVNISGDSLSRIEIGTRFVADYEPAVIAKALGADISDLIKLE